MRLLGRARMTWVPLREPGTGKLLARYDPERDIIEFQRRGIKTVVDLRQVKESASERQARHLDGGGTERSATAT